ncbi:transglutaminase-like domain-containing protein [Planctomicrobium piriforme]|uniref:Transglutaminase-like enzyme, putative cysteine protease n=1 Tax=Planctomicrobium piriforme TaxID=1576369 RepID=A0A1I3D8N3_9PLAN|nr:transglutaminase family protein [Planctomicrobium piriforme]SFH83070.1 Transglutaminase-like enzyme, putative cysteine protease [Planctomicrobium piriforme]
MQFQVFSELEYEASFPSTMILNIHAQRNPSQEIVEEKLTLLPELQSEEIVVGENRFLRVQTGELKNFTIVYEATVDVEYELLSAKQIDPLPISEFSPEVIPYLFPSRYCQSDRLSRLAWDLFGNIKRPYDTVMAITDWIYDNVEYMPGTTNSQTSAYDTVTQRTGVCRDFAHLGIALCRALNIPARYFTGYAYQLDPPDFHALFEAFIGGSWIIFDATRLSSPNGLVKIGNGRDAAEAAVSSIFGRVEGKSMTVRCELVPGQDYKPMNRRQLGHKGVSLETVEQA